MASLSRGPEFRAGYPVWKLAEDGVEVAFVGRGRPAERSEILRRIRGAELPVAWAAQVHGARCSPATPGCVGEADALTIDRPGLALAVSTADCVPVVLARDGALAVVHAGWRGIVAGVVAAAARRLGLRSRPARAWIGPAIGPCCYVVGADVAREVAAAAKNPSVVDRTSDGDPRLDLVAAVTSQLEREGVERVDVVRACTRCRDDLHSYRRDGERAGRNLTLAWLADHA